MLLTSAVDAIGLDAMEVKVEVTIFEVVVDQLATIRKKKMVKMGKEIRAMEEHRSKVKTESHVNEGLDLEDLVVEDIKQAVVVRNMAATSVVVNQNAMAIPRMMEQLENLREKELEMVTTKEIVHLVEEALDASAMMLVVPWAEVQEVLAPKVAVEWAVGREVLALHLDEEVHEAVIIPIMNLKHFWN